MTPRTRGESTTSRNLKHSPLLLRFLASSNDRVKAVEQRGRIWSKFSERRTQSVMELWVSIFFQHSMFQPSMKMSNDFSNNHLKYSLYSNPNFHSFVAYDVRSFNPLKKHSLRPFEGSLKSFSRHLSERLDQVEGEDSRNPKVA